MQRAIVAAPYCVSNAVIMHDSPLESIEEATHQLSTNYSERVSVQPNVLANNLNAVSNSKVRRLKRVSFKFDKQPVYQTN